MENNKTKSEWIASWGLALAIVVVYSVPLILQLSFLHGFFWLGISAMLLTATSLSDANSKSRILLIALLFCDVLLYLWWIPAWWASLIFLSIAEVFFFRTIFSYSLFSFATVITAHAISAHREKLSIGYFFYYVLFLILILVAFVLVKIAVYHFSQTKKKLDNALTLSAIDCMTEHKLRMQIAQETRMRTENARLSERERISRDIHNAVGHTLSAAAISLDAANVLLPEDQEEASKKITLANDRVHEAISSVRSVVRTLEANEMILVTDYIHSIQEMLSTFEMEAEISIRSFFLADDNGTEEAFQSLSIDTAVFLTNAMQELLTNSSKHGAATVIVIVMSFRKEGIALSFEDNGKGFGTLSNEKKQSLIRNGFGLRKIRDYVNENGGSLTIDGSDGFSVHITLPGGKVI
ncbi:MAG TPA: histidine kinase [Bacillota bacterium]|nr:histidine kinase [Bacillota bacterium]HPE39108.1 histidine kinase [Bacillota bacterium]